MATLEENRSLLQRILNLPANDAELKKKGLSSEDINAFKDFFCLIDPEANKQVKRMREIIEYLDRLDAQKK